MTGAHFACLKPIELLSLLYWQKNAPSETEATSLATMHSGLFSYYLYARGACAIPDRAAYEYSRTRSYSQ